MMAVSGCREQTLHCAELTPQDALGTHIWSLALSASLVDPWREPLRPWMVLAGGTQVLSAWEGIRRRGWPRPIDERSGQLEAGIVLWTGGPHAISEMDFQCLISRALLPIGVAICVRDFASDFVVKNEASARPLPSPLFSPQVLRMIR